MQHPCSLCRPVYTQIQISTHWKEKKNQKKKLIFKFSVFSHSPGAVLFIYVTFAAIGYWEVRAAIMLECTRFGNRRLHCARLRFVSCQEHLFPHCSGTFYISSLPFHFVLSEINFHTASKKMADTHTLQWIYKPRFELLENSVLRLHTAQYRNWHYGNEKLPDLHMNPELGIFSTGKQTNHKTYLKLLGF